MVRALGTLRGYAFLTTRGDNDDRRGDDNDRRGDDNDRRGDNNDRRGDEIRDDDDRKDNDQMFDMHSLVHLATRIWVQQEGLTVEDSENGNSAI